MKSESCERPDHLRPRILLNSVPIQIGHTLPRFEVSWPHTNKHTRWDSSERMISSSQRALPTQRTTNTRDEYICPQRDLNPAIPATKRLQTCALIRTATGIRMVIPPSPPPVRGARFYGHIQVHVNWWFEICSLCVLGWKKARLCLFFGQNFTQHSSNVIIS